MEKPQVLPDRCVRRLSRKVGCRACEQGCPKAAIVLRERPFRLSLNGRCDGCGLCWTKCPAEAILPPLDQKDACRPEELGVICRRADTDWMEMPKGADLRVPCVKEIGFPFLATRWMAGLRRLVVHGADCSGCNAVPSPNQEDGLKGVNEILRVAGRTPIEVVPGGSSRRSGNKAGGSPISEGTQRAATRRGLLKTMIAGSLDVVFPSAREGPDTSDTTGVFVAFLQALDGMGNVNKEERQGRLAAYRLGVNARLCYGCKVCATLCPTGAVHWEEDAATPGSARIRIDPSMCVGCRVCVDLCDAGAIDCTFMPGPRVQQEIPLHEGRCRVCDRMFLASHTGEGLCPGCRPYDRKLSPDAARAARRKSQERLRGVSDRVKQDKGERTIRRHRWGGEP